MSFGLSPSIDINERDFLSPSRQTANRFAAMVGNFNWGPVEERVLIDEEKTLVNTFNPPSIANRADWFSAANYLAYNDKLYVVRAIKAAGSKNAGIAIFSKALKTLVLENVVGDFVAGDVISGITSLAEGVVVKVVVDGLITSLIIDVTSGTFEEAEDITDGENVPKTATITSITDNVKTFPFAELKKNFDHDVVVSDEDYIKFKILAKYVGVYGNNISVAIANSSNFATANIIGTTTFKANFEFAPASSEVAIVVLLNGGIVEKHLVSLVPGAKNYKGENYYIETYLNKVSKYIYVYDNHTINTVQSVESIALAQGVHAAPEAGDYMDGYDLFENKEEIDIDVIFESGCVDIASGETVAQHMIDEILEKRKDCRGVFGPKKSDVVSQTVATAVSNMITYVTSTLNKDSSFAAFYGNYKYQYDRYNDEFIWVPITGDIAGIYAVGQAWEAPAGVNRGLIKNCVKLAVNPSEGYRDQMYPVAINPIYTLKNVGHVVQGQKTLKTSTPSLFSRVDVRGLFILLQKNASDVSRFYQFQKNTATERRRFVADVEPLFRIVQGLGGIEEYLIICDESNNTGDVTSTLTMIADFYVKPAQSAEWIRLNFNATQATVNFEEIVSSPYTV
jgi:hypothetical protein